MGNDLATNYTLDSTKKIKNPISITTRSKDKKIYMFKLWGEEVTIDGRNYTIPRGGGEESKPKKNKRNSSDDAISNSRKIRKVSCIL